MNCDKLIRPRADKSALGAMNRPLRAARRPRFIVGTADLSAPWDSWVNLLHPIIGPSIYIPINFLLTCTCKR